MNWNPLKRSTLNARPEMDSITQNASETLARLVAEFDSAENVTKSLYLTAKKLPDHILCTGKFETKLTDDLSSANLFSRDEFMQNIMEEWHDFAFVNNTIGDEYVVSLQRTLMEPLKQLKQAFCELRAAIRLHDSVQQDVIKFQRKVASHGEKERTGANLVKLQESKQSLAASQKEYANRTQTLINDLSKFLTGSVDILQPILEGFIAAEVAWARACKRNMDNRTHITATTQVETQSDRLKNIEDSFRAMGSLSICADTR